jgi:hypothetical protein
MAFRLLSASVFVIAGVTACSLFAPSDSEFLQQPGAGTAGAGAAGTVGTDATGGENGATADAAVGSGGTGGAGAGDNDGGTSSTQSGGASDGVAGRGGTSGSAGGSGASAGSSGACADAGDICQNPSLECSDGSCSQLAWNFDSLLVAGVSSDLPLAVRQFDGGPALALDIAQLNQVNQVSITLVICATGNVDLRSKRLSFRVYFQGVPQSTHELMVQAWLPARPANDARLGAVVPATGTWTTFSAALSESAFSGSTTTIAIEAATTGVAFSGTIWFDDIRIQ